MKRTIGKVTELVVVFRDCLRALTPYVGKAGIEWEDGKSYDDWDAIAQTLYSTIVGETIVYTVEGENFSKLTPYGLVMPNYTGQSFLFCAQHGRGAPFLKLEGIRPPFDTAVFLELDATDKPTGRETRAPLSKCEFLALLRSSRGERELVDVILKEGSS